MSDLGRVSPEGEAPVNPYSLLEAVNRSSDTAHTAWLIFILIMTYLMIAVAGVTHTNLLLETPVSLPILQVDIPLTQFFQFAPLVLAMFHLGVVSQLVLLARKALEFDHAIRLLEPTSKRTHPLRLEVHNMFFVQAIAGPHRSKIMGGFLHGMSWLTLVILPVVLLLYIQIVFLPYHDEIITWTHRIVLLADIMFLVLIGVFLMRAETSFFKAFFRTTAAHPVSFLMTTVVLGIVTIFSFFVATVPGERLDSISQALYWKMQSDDDRTTAPKYYSGFVVPLIPVDAEGALFGIFRRNLVVTDADLVSDKEVTEGEPTLKLRDRDLRYAKLDRSDMHQADLTGADLSDASLDGTDLRNATMQCAELNVLRLKNDRKRAKCVRAVSTNFARAELSGALLTGIDARGANFEEAILEDADIGESVLAGANFSQARLDKANLTGGVEAAGANFAIASLQGTNLNGGRLYGADFRWATMQAAILDYARLEGALLEGADLEAASLYKAHVQGADFTGAKLTAADFRSAKIWMTGPPSPSAVDLLDFDGVKIQPIADAAAKSLQKAIAALDSQRLERRVTESLAKLLDKKIMNAWESDPQQQNWRALIGNSSSSAAAVPAPQPVGAGDPDAFADPPPALAASTFYGQQLTEHLETMVCRVRWINGAVATGVALRAIAPQFRGDLSVIDERLSGEECIAAQGVPARVVRELQTTADRSRDR
ncbi:MAG: pentapeptide repeat-containing protein [Alphaproteobacteria bacterium]|nr:pentapeptide repeat-containing protein [Alphaproteobacteria bacterium]